MNRNTPTYLGDLLRDAACVVDRLGPLPSASVNIRQDLDGKPHISINIEHPAAHHRALIAAAGRELGFEESGVTLALNAIVDAEAWRRSVEGGAE